MLMMSLSLFAEKHTVQRGESLQSIADKYKVSVAQLVEANPGSDNLFYVGLILNIPTSKEVVIDRTGDVTQEPALPLNQPKNQTIAEVKQGTDVESTFQEVGPGYDFAMVLEYGFLSKPEGVSGSNWTYGVTVGINYFFNEIGKKLFVGARVGYNSANYSMSARYQGDYVSSEMTSHFISIPLNVGYAISSDDKRFAISPLAGFDINLCVSGNQKYKVRGSYGYSDENKVKLKKKMGLDARVGAQLRLWGFDVGVSYIIPLDKNDKMYFGDDAYVALNIGWGF